MSNTGRVCHRVVAFLCAVLVGACANLPPLPAASGDEPYHLDSGDKVRLIVYSDQALSQEYAVGDDGMISVPIIGEVKARGETTREIRDAIIAKLKTKGVYANPGVSVEVSLYRPFFITGEVAKPGSYPYVAGLDVLSAVAIAGGFTVRADKDTMTLVRRHDGIAVQYGASGSALLRPGDVIVVGESLL